MSTSYPSRLASATLASVFSATLAFAQTAAPASTDPADAKKDDAVVLSPFQVNTSTDEGYAARLAGA